MWPCCYVAGGLCMDCADYVGDACVGGDDADDADD